MTTKKKKMPSGYGMVQTAVMKLPGLSMSAKAVYSLLASYTGNQEYCWPTLETIIEGQIKRHQRFSDLLYRLIK